jgi:hypothetical protein
VESAPFSKTHCQEIRKLAENGFGPMVRSGYHSLLMFELPEFLSPKFKKIVYNSARAVGSDASLFTIKNLPENWRSRLEIAFKDDAMSRKLGHVSTFYEQLHLEKNGVKNSFDTTITVLAGDIICDLISGDAKLIMIYPVGDEGRTIKIEYGPLIVTQKG